MLAIVHAHDPAHPLLLFYTPHVAHMPLQVPARYLDRFIPLANGSDERVCGGFKFPCKPPNPFVVNPTHPGVFSCRAQYHASVTLLDDVIGEVTQALKRKNMWENTLMIFSSDNGGPININSNAANNFPLRGGKFGSLEGGIRSAAFVSGGFLPASARGTQCHGMVPPLTLIPPPSK